MSAPTMTYEQFLAARAQHDNASGFEPTHLPEHLFGFQRDLVDWAVRMGRAALFADCGLGKAQPVDEPVLTPAGWRPIGDLRVGDQVIAVDGGTTRIVGVYPQGRRPTVTVTFNDGAIARCDENHLWTVATDLDISRGRPWRTLTVRQLLERGLELPPRNGPRWRIPVARPIQHPAAALAIDPYIMGALLGDGSFRPPTGPELTCADPEIAAEVKSRLPAGMQLSADASRGRAPTYRLAVVGHAKRNPYLAALRSWGLHGRLSYEKFVPAEYFFASAEQRLGLLRGLMDTDGFVAADGTTQFGSSSPQLAAGVLALVRSLGGVARQSTKIPTYTHKGERRSGRRHYTLTIALPDGTVPFLLPRKVARCADRYYAPQRKIAAIHPDGTSECVCIAIDHPSQLYVTRDYVVTHNTPMALAWAVNVHQHTGRPVLIACPLAVSFQIAQEAAKFGVDAAVSRDGRPAAGVTITNYERLERFDTDQYGGVVCDESSAIKAFDGQRRAIVTEFLRTQPYRLLATATAAPNDYIELGTSSEALGYLGHMDMLGRFFVNDQRTAGTGRYRGQSAAWRFKGHAADPFWRWVASWARAIRRPSDLGYDDTGFVLPPLEYRQHTVAARTARDDTLFDLPAVGLREERDESRRTLVERCEQAAKALVDAEPGVAWCHLNAESSLLTELIDGAVEITGAMSPDEKEERLLAFGRGDIRVLVTKPAIGAWGLNWQHCHRVAYFPSHSFEQAYQAVRRCWRFGQQHPVVVDLITSEGGANALANLQRKAAAADAMFDALTAHMRDAADVARTTVYDQEVQVPAWL